MKNSSMQIPPLSQLFKQKQDYNAHKQKLLQIRSNRKKNLLEDSYNIALMDNVRKNLQKHGHRSYAKSQEVAQQNQKLVQKLQNIKPRLSFKYNQKPMFQSRVVRSISSRKALMEQRQRQNSRIKNRVKSMSSSLNNKSLLKDYRKSVQIRNRLMHFKTQSNHKVVLKMNRYLEPNYKRQVCNTVKILKQQKQVLPSINYATNSTKNVVQDKLGKICRNGYSDYAKKDVIESKINLNNKLYKLARQRRSKALTVLQKKSKLCTNQMQSKGIFATELQGHKK